MSYVNRGIVGLVGVLALAWASSPVAIANPQCGALPGLGWTWQTSEAWGNPFTFTTVSDVNYRGRSGNGDAEVSILVLQHRLLMCQAITPEGVVGPMPATPVVIEAVVVDEFFQDGGRVCHQARKKADLIDDCRAPAGR